MKCVCNRGGRVRVRVGGIQWDEDTEFLLSLKTFPFCFLSGHLWCNKCRKYKNIETNQVHEESGL